MRAAPHEERAAPTDELPCWNCDKAHKVVDRFCNDCDVLLEAPRGRDYFALFELSDQEYDVDVRRLEEHFRGLLQSLHPDKFASRTKLEQRFAAAHATLVNQAYQVLRDPVERARYMLKRRGYDVEGAGGDPPPADSTVPGGGRPKEPLKRVRPSAEMLMEMMELREEVAEADGPEELQRLHEDARRRMAAAVAEASEAFRGGELEQCAQATLRLLFINNIAKELAQLCPAT